MPKNVRPKFRNFRLPPFRFTLYSADRGGWAFTFFEGRLFALCRYGSIWSRAYPLKRYSITIFGKHFYFGETPRGETSPASPSHGGKSRA